MESLNFSNSFSWVPAAAASLTLLSFCPVHASDSVSTTIPPVSSAGDQGKAEEVADAPYAFDVTNVGTVEVYKSVNGGRFYIAPQLRFVLLDDPPAVARLSSIEADGAQEAQISILMVAPNVREAVATRLTELSGATVKVENVGNLRVYAIVVDMNSDQVKSKYGVQSFTIQYPTYSQTLDAAIMVNSEHAKEFVAAVNRGDITFRLSYVYKAISLDNRVERLDIKLVRDSSTLQNLTQKGQNLMSATQMGEAANSIQRELTSTVVEGLGKIQPSSLPVSRLLEIFSIGDTWKKDDEELSRLDDQVRKQFNLNVNPADFQPFRVQKHVIETLNTSTDVASQRQRYAAEHDKNKNSWNVSGGFGIGPFSASGGYAEESEKVKDNSQMSDDQFRQMVQKYHGAVYDTEERLWRGLQVYDAEKINSVASTSVLSVTYKPEVSSGIRNVTVRPSVRSLAQPVPTNPNAPVSFNISYPGTNARHDFVQLDATTWVENYSENNESKILRYYGRKTVDGNTGTVLKEVDVDFYLFIPDKGSAGQWPTMLRQKWGGNDSWGPFTYMLSYK